MLLFLLILVGPVGAGTAGATPLERIGVVSPISPALLQESRSAPPPEMESAIHWQNYLRPFAAEIRLIGLSELPRRIGNLDLVVLPDIRDIRPDQRDGILDFIREGGSAILTGRTGAEGGEPALETLAGALGLNYHDMDSGPRRTDSWWVIMDHPSALAAGIPKMQHLAIGADNPPTLEGGPGLAFWAPIGGGSPDLVVAGRNPAAVHGRHGRGQFLWTGFDLSQVGGDLASSENFHRLIQNSVQYFAGRATLEVAPWPYPFTGAVIFSMDVEEQFGNIQRVEALDNLPPFTYFILTQPAGLYEDILAELAQAESPRREIAIHGDNHDVFRDQPPQIQHRRLRETSDYVNEITGSPAVGFRPPEEAYDYFTWEALVENNYEYVLGNHSTDRAEPIFVTHNGTTMVQLSMVNKDDVKMITMAGNPPPNEVLDAYIEDVDSLLAREALYITNLHSQILATEKYIDVLHDFIHYVEGRGPWMANAGQVVDWWWKRRGVALELEISSPDQAIFHIANSGPKAVEDLAIDIWLPRGARNTRIESPPGGRRILEYQEDDTRLRLRIPLLLPDDARTYQVQWING